MQRITGKVRVITGVLSDKRSKYSVVGTKTPKFQYIFNFCRFRRSFTNEYFPPKPPSIGSDFYSSQVNF